MRLLGAAKFAVLACDLAELLTDAAAEHDRVLIVGSRREGNARARG